MTLRYACSFRSDFFKRMGKAVLIQSRMTSDFPWSRSKATLESAWANSFGALKVMISLSPLDIFLPSIKGLTKIYGCFRFGKSLTASIALLIVPSGIFLPRRIIERYASVIPR